jgi:hypothetical protein
MAAYTCDTPMPSPMKIMRLFGFCLSLPAEASITAIKARIKVLVKYFI